MNEETYHAYFDHAGRSQHALPRVMSFENEIDVQQKEIDKILEMEQLQQEHVRRYSTKSLDSVRFSNDSGRISNDHILDPAMTPLRVQVLPVETNSTIPIRVMDEQGQTMYKVEMNGDMTDICVMNPNKKELCRITKDILSIHPSFSIHHKFRKIAKCTQRFKLASKQKKFNYRMIYGPTIKMTGYYNQSSWVVRHNLKVIGSVNVINSREYEIRVMSTDIDRFHILMLCFIMMEQKFNNTNIKIY
jgi:uncharacterized protein YxjI